MEEIELEIKKLKEEVKSLYLSLNESYVYIKKEIIEICEDANQGIYIPQNHFERILDILLDYGLNVDVKNEFDLMIKSYYSKYPDSVKIYQDYYNEMLEEE